MSEERLWTERAFRPADDGCLLHLWAKTIAYRTRSGAMRNTQDRNRLWSETRRYALSLLTMGRTRVAVDKDDDDVIWGFSCTTDNVVHFAAVKPAFREEERKIVDALLDHVPTSDATIQYSHVIPAWPCMPHAWTYNPHCLPLLIGDNQL